MTDVAPWPILSAMSMADLEALTDWQLALLGIWREEAARPPVVGAALRRMERQGKHSSQARQRRRLVR